MVNFSNPVQTITGANGLPLAHGRVWFFEPDTDILKPIYTDLAQTTEAPNPYLLGADARMPVFATGLYSMLVERQVAPGLPGTYAEEYTIPRYQADMTYAVVASDAFTVANVADMRLVDPVEHPIVDLQGYFNTGDGGGGLMIYRAVSAYIPNDFTVFTSTVATGHWVRCWTPIINPMMAGAFSTTYSTQPVDSRLTVISQWTQLVPMWCNLFIPSGTWKIAGRASFIGSNLNVTCAPGAVFDLGLLGGEIYVNCGGFQAENGKRLMTGNDNGLFWLPSNKITPDACWFGADPSGATNCGPVLARAVTTDYNNSGALRITAPLVKTTTEVLAQNTMIIFDNKGSINLGGALFYVGRYVNNTGFACWLGDSLDNLRFQSGANLAISDICDGALTSSRLKDSHTAITNNGTEHGTLIWDRPLVITGTLLVDTMVPYVTNQFTGKGYIDGMEQAYPLGFIEAPPQGRIFSSAIAKLAITNPVGYVGWFGDDNLGRCAGLQALIDSGVIVDGNNAVLSLINPLVQPGATDYEGDLRLQNMWLDASLDLQGDPMITPDHILNTLWMHNVSIDGHGNPTTLTSFENAAWTVDIAGCATRNLIFSLTGPQTQGSVTRNNFYATKVNLTQTPNLLVANNYVGLEDYSSVVVTIVAFPGVSTVSPLLINPEIHVEAAVAGGTVDNLQVVDNILGFQTDNPLGIWGFYNGNITAGNCIAGTGTIIARNGISSILTLNPTGFNYSGTTVADTAITFDDVEVPGPVGYIHSTIYGGTATIDHVVRGGVGLVKGANKPANLLMAGAHPKKCEILSISRSDLASTRKAVICNLTTESLATYFQPLFISFGWEASPSNSAGLTTISLRLYA